MDEISEIKNEKRILDAIDQLRRRKARPDVDRICNYMMRKFLIDPGETVADLERLVDNDVVIKVEYKGNTSYRNAAKWSRYALYKNRPESGSISIGLNSERMSALFAAALSELSSLDTASTNGVSYSEIESYLQRKDAHFSKKLLDFMIVRELNARNISRLANGNFVLTATGKDRSTNADNIKLEEKDVVKEKEEEEEEKSPVEIINESEADKNTPKPNVINGKTVEGQNSNASESGAVTVGGYRIGVRRKRAKIVFDPSDHRAPAPRKRGRPAGSSNKNHHQHHIGVHIHHSNNSSNNHSHIGNGSSNSNSSTNGSHSLSGINLGVSGRHPLELKDQILKAHRPTSVIQTLPNNDNKRGSITFGVEGLCYVCGQGSNCRERLINCRDCVTNKVHPSCLHEQDGGNSAVDGDSSGRNLGHSLGQSWQCADCRSCCICGGVSDSTSMVSCDGCEEWYHMYCHTPVLHERPRGGKWLCQHCLTDRTTFAHSVNGVGGLPTPRESPIPEGSQHHGENGVCENGISDMETDVKHPTCNDHVENEGKNTHSTSVKQKPVPDASNWTPSDVEFYFRSVGFPEQAHVFKDQEVDGKSLLLMKRSDVLTGLGLKLGPALKMYTHVRRLQLRQHDDMAASEFIWA